MMPTESKVTNFDIVVLVEEYVLKFEISMHNMPFMHVGEGIDNLLEYRCYFFIWEMFLFLMN